MNHSSFTYFSIVNLLIDSRIRERFTRFFNVHFNHNELHFIIPIEQTPPYLYNKSIKRKGKRFLKLYVIIAVVLIIIAYFVFTMLRLRKAVTNLSQDEFIAGYRKAQLIDVREPKDFDAGHILGARNIPYSQFRQRYQEIRPDKPVYLYDQNGGKSARAALFLKKKNYSQLYHLQGGFRLWTGKVKSK